MIKDLSSIDFFVLRYVSLILTIGQNKNIDTNQILLQFIISCQLISKIKNLSRFIYIACILIVCCFSEKVGNKRGRPINFCFGYRYNSLVCIVYGNKQINCFIIVRNSITIDFMLPLFA